MRKLYALVALVMVIGLALGGTVVFENNKVPTKEGDLIADEDAPSATLPIVDAGKSFSIKVNNWDKNKLTAKVTITLPVYSKNEVQSCVVQSKSTHFDPVTGKQTTSEYEGSCNYAGDTTLQIIDGGTLNTVTGKKYECPMDVLEGVTEFTVTCEDKVGQKTSASSKFVLDRLAPYLVPNTFNYTTVKLTGIKNLSPEISFKIRDMSYSTCTLTFQTHEDTPYTFFCIPSEDHKFGEMNEFTMICQQETLTLPLGLLDPSKKPNLTCSDDAGNEIMLKDLSIAPEISNIAMSKEDVESLIRKMCTYAWSGATPVELNDENIQSARESGKLESKDSEGAYALVMLRSDTDGITINDIHKISDDLKILGENRDCGGALLACAGLCGLDIFTLAQAKILAKRSVEEAMSKSTEKVIEKGAKSMKKTLETASENLDDITGLEKGISEFKGATKADDAIKKLGNLEESVNENIKNLEEELKQIKETKPSNIMETAEMGGKAKRIKKSIKALEDLQKQIEKTKKALQKIEGGRVYKIKLLYGDQNKWRMLVSPFGAYKLESGITATVKSNIKSWYFARTAFRPIRRLIGEQYMRQTPYTYKYEDILPRELENYNIRQPATDKGNNPLYSMGNMALETLMGFAPCGDLLVTVKQTWADEDYPDIITTYDQSRTSGNEIMQPGHSYMIYARIERQDMSSHPALQKPVVQQFGQCLFGCPDYACVVTIVPNQAEY